MTYSAYDRDIAAIRPIAAQARQPDAELIALLSGSAPISAAQWQRIREIEASTEQ